MHHTTRPQESRRPTRLITSIAAAAATVVAMLVMAPAANVAVFDIDHAIQLGADQEATQQYASAWVEAGGTIVGMSAAASANIAKSTEASAMTLAACRGTTGFTGFYWFGPQTGLDSCLTQTFINAIGVAAAGGGTYAAISALTVAGLPQGAVVGVVAAVLGLGVAFLNVCRDTSSINAIYLNGGIPGAVPPSCWAQ